MTRTEISPEGFEAAAVANAMTLVALFHSAVRLARQLIADSLDVAADKLMSGVCQAVNDMAGYRVIDRDLVMQWLYDEPRTGNGFHGTYDCGRGHTDAYYWMVRFGGAWETVGVDGDGTVEPEREIYWGGELSSTTLMIAVAQALYFQAKWPEAEVRISRGEHDEVLRIPAILGTEVPR